MRAGVLQGTGEGTPAAVAAEVGLGVGHMGLVVLTISHEPGAAVAI